MRRVEPEIRETARLQLRPYRPALLTDPEVMRFVLEKVDMPFWPGERDEIGPYAVYGIDREAGAPPSDRGSIRAARAS